MQSQENPAVQSVVNRRNSYDKTEPRYQTMPRRVGPSAPYWALLRLQMLPLLHSNYRHWSNRRVLSTIGVR